MFWLGHTDWNSPNFLLLLSWGPVWFNICLGQKCPSLKNKLCGHSKISSLFYYKMGGLVFVLFCFFDSVWYMLHFLKLGICSFYQFWKLFWIIPFAFSAFPSGGLFRLVRIFSFCLLYVLTTLLFHVFIFLLLCRVSTDFSFSSLTHSSAVITQVFNPSTEAFDLIDLYFLFSQFHFIFIQICLFFFSIVSSLKVLITSTSVLTSVLFLTWIS